jgi:hypothetical protein
MVGWKTHGRRVLPQVADPQGIGVGDELAEHALSLGQRAHPCRLLVVDADVDEPRQPRAVLAQHAEGSVAGLDEAGGGLNDPAQRDVEVEARRDAHERVQQVLHPRLRPGDGRQPLLDLLEQFGEPHAGQSRREVGMPRRRGLA